MVKKINIFILIFVMLFSLIACSKSDNVDPSADDKVETEKKVNLKKFKGKKIKVWTYTKDIYEIAKVFEKKYSCQVEIELIDYDGYEKVLASVIDSANDIPDVFTIESKNLGDFVDRQVLKDLGPYIDVDNYIKYTIDEARDSTGKVKGLSWHVAPKMIYYRKSFFDLAKEEDKNADYYFASLDSILELSKLLEKAGDYRFFPNLNAAIELVEVDKAWKIENDTLLVTDLGKEYLKMFREFNKSRMFINIDTWSKEWLQGMYKEVTIPETGKKTQVFSYLLPTWAFEYGLKLAGEEGAEPLNITSGDWQVISPIVNTYEGGTWLSVYENSSESELAVEFVKFVTSDKESVPSWLKELRDYPAYIPLYEDPVFDYEDEFLANTKISDIVLNNAKQVRSLKRSQEEKTYDEKFVQILKDYSQGRIAELEQAIRLFQE